jgi:Putative Actinobacterial Holin-X, holin superfamily III
VLKPPNDEPPAQPHDQPVGELISRAIEDGKAYARAELNVVKAIVEEKVSAVKAPAIALVAALLFAQAAIIAVALGVTMALATLVGPLLAGVIGLALFVGLAGGLAWWAVNKARSAW